MEPDDLRVIACNYREGTSVVSPGSKAYVLISIAGNGCERMRVFVRSRSGRYVEKWEAMWRLTNFRPKTIPPRHTLRSKMRELSLEEGTAATCDALNRMAEYWHGVHHHLPVTPPWQEPRSMQDSFTG